MILAAVDEAWICAGWELSRACLTLPVCAVVRQDVAARRTRPPSRNALSAVFQREGALLFLFIFFNFGPFSFGQR